MHTNYAILFDDCDSIIYVFSESDDDKESEVKFEKKFEDKIVCYPTFTNLFHYKIERNFIYKEIFFLENYLSICTPPPEFS